MERVMQKCRKCGRETPEEVLKSNWWICPGCGGYFRMSARERIRLVVDEGSKGLEFFADDDISRYATGDRVRVKEGPLRGTEGYIKRIRRDRRLLVVIEGIIAVAAIYIPPQHLEKI